MTKYKFRAECWRDVMELLKQFPSQELKMSTRLFPDIPPFDVEVILETENYSLEQLQTMMWNIQDGYVMAQSVALEADYTGERDLDLEPTEDDLIIPMRDEDEISEAAGEYDSKVWWNRHQNLLHRIQTGEEVVVEEYGATHVPNTISKESLATARAAAKKIEDKYGAENLGWDDFEWGMVNGKLSALRWVLGDEWDQLDT